MIKSFVIDMIKKNNYSNVVLNSTRHTLYMYIVVKVWPAFVN